MNDELTVMTIKVEGDEQVQAILAVLTEAEENGELDFPFSVHVTD